MHNASVDDRRLTGIQFLGLAIEVDSPNSLTDVYQRGGDLIAHYRQTSDRPFSVLVYWRAGLSGIGPIRFPFVDLVVSVETSLLDSRPQLEAQTILPTSLADGSYCRSSDYWLGRFDSQSLSYVEVPHPDDELTPSIAKTESGLQASTPLFGQPLEKGVILRSRLRGLFVPRADDERLAVAAMAEFAAAPPPLTT